MSLELTGKIVVVLPSTAGTTKGKNWEKREYVLETVAQYPRKMRFIAFNSDDKTFPTLSVGDAVKVSFDIDCRESQGNWYNDIKAWKIESVQ